MFGNAYTTVAIAAIVALVQPSRSALAGIETFLSRPNQTSAVLRVDINKDPSALGPGYIFITPYNLALTGRFGTQIHEMSGELVFSGQYLQEKRAMNSHVCNREGKPTICFTDAVPGEDGPGHSSGPDRFFNQHYEQVGPDYTTGKGLASPDAHELNTAKSLKGKGFIRDIFQPVKMDLRQYDGPKNGYILAGCFQQVSFDGNKVDFQWCSNTEVELYETYSYIAGNKAGNQSNPKNHGTQKKPWDYFHINSIDRDDNGDYYVSSRQCHTIFKVAGPQSSNPGKVLWRLGGRYSDFKLSAKEKFSQQHDIRVHEVKGDITVVSLFDNHAPNGAGTNDAPATTAKWFRLNEKKKSVKLLQYYLQPEKKFTPTGGQASNIKGGNAFIGWGKIPAVSEHRRSKGGKPGEVLYYAKFNGDYQSYKSYKETWVGKPSLPPDVFAYQQSCDSSHMAVYMSWNGATEYAGFKVFAHSKRGSSIKEAKHIGTFKRHGYETKKKIRSSKFHKFITVQATNKKGKVMATSKPMEVFVPNRKLRKQCNTMRCPEGTTYGSHHSVANKC